MNPVELGRGRSFKGLAAYLLHDVSEEEGEKATSSERVGWTQSINLNDASADKAWRLMASTAKSAPALKEAAGLPKGGGVNNKPVYHYTVTWPQEDSDKVSEQLQRKAVTESLAALKLEGHQALAIEHTDENHKHVHVMVNLINPEDGTTPKLSYTKKNLRKWANKFEQTHGLKVSEGSRANEEKRRNGEQVNARRKPRNVYEQEKREGNDRRTAWLRKQGNQIAQTLQIQNKEMHKRHSDEWTAIKGAYYTRRDALRDDREAAIKQATLNVKARYKSQWADEFKKSRDQLKKHDQAEKHGLPQLFNAGRTFLAARKQGQGVVKSFSAATSPEERRATVERKNKSREDALGSKVKKDIKETVQKVRQDHDKQLASARNQFLQECDQLKKQQTAEKSEQRQQWQQYNEQRNTSHEQIAGHQQINAEQYTQAPQQNQAVNQNQHLTLDPPK